MIFIASVAESFVPLQNIGLLAILATATSMIVLPFISTVISKKTALNGHLILGWLMLCTGIAGIIFLKSRTSLLMSMATLAMFQIGVNRF